MSLPVKAGIGLATIGTVGGVGYGIVAYSQDKGTEISKLIEEEFKYKLLDTTEGDPDKDKSYWTANWDNYKKDNKDKAKDIFELQGWKSDGSVDVTPKLKEKCATLKNEKVYSKDDDLYKNVTNYCGRYLTVKDQAGKNNLTILKTTASSTDEGIWEKKHGKTTDLAKDFKKIGIVEEKPSKEQIRDGCGKAATEKTKKESDYEAIYASYVKVCTKQEGE